MSAGKRNFLIVAVLLTLAAPALAAGGEGSALLGFTVGCALVLLAALPFAVVLRATCDFPQKISASLTERAHLKRFAGIASLICAIAFLNVGKFNVLPLTVLAIIAGFAMAAALIGGLISASTFLGRRLFSDPARGESVGAFILGWLLLAGTTLIPVAGALYVLYHMTWGAGAILVGLFGGKRKNQPDSAQA